MSEDSHFGRTRRPSSTSRSVSGRLEVSVEDLRKKLVSLEVVKADKFDSAYETIGPNGDPTTVVDALEQSGNLTPFQAERLRSGSASDICFDDYVLLDKLGEGGMGEVYKARNSVLGRTEAIKTIRCSANKSEAVLKRFKQEARVLALLEHPAIVPIYKVGHVNGVDYIAMKFVTGEDLRSRVDNAFQAGAPVSIKTCCEWISEAADALGHAHQHNVIHRDIKPANLMVTATGKLIVLDMGIARLADPDQSTSAGLTAQRRGMGTPEYMPPEQWADATAVKPASDIYALGATLFYLLTGHVPFERKDLVALMRACAREEPPPASSHRGEIPPELDAVINKMLAKKPEDRFESALEVIDALRPFACPGELSAKTLPRFRASDEIRKPKSRSPWVPIFGVVLVLLLSGGIWVGIGSFFLNSSFQQRAENLLAFAQSQDPDVWPSVESLKAAIAGKGFSSLGEIKTKEQFGNFQSLLVKLTKERKKTLLREDPPPAWLVEYQSKHPKDWPSIAPLYEQAKRLSGGRDLDEARDLVAPDGALATLTFERARERREREAKEWLARHQRRNSDLWANTQELIDYAGTILPLSQLETDAMVAKMTKGVEEETDRLARPFHGWQLDHLSPAHFREVSNAREALSQILSLHEIVPPPNAKMTMKAEVRNASGDVVDRVKVGEPFTLHVKVDREAYVTVVEFDRGTITILGADVLKDKWQAGVTRQVTNGSFITSAPGEERFAIYVTDEPLVYATVQYEHDDPEVLTKVFPTSQIEKRIHDSVIEGKKLLIVPPHRVISNWDHQLVTIDVVD
ncbi:Serine/threonine-protein kinase PknB [Planctomycetes bacterium Pan216]|uniref:Serine/threonine-protein kinase PknB n=1 Tax=Kolteria novifilia TaxID=2527975 RepID=A0A518B345_9BACT|nr:Serine/threonine-protein kinase PknB [Planctomycetes bacterium Pan216]